MLQERRYQFQSDSGDYILRQKESSTIFEIKVKGQELYFKFLYKKKHYY